MWRTLIGFAIGLSLVSVPDSLAQKTKKFPGEATVTDGNVNAIESDSADSGTNAYVDSEEVCVSAASQGSGQFTLWTVALEDDCSFGLGQGEWRYINFPLTNPIPGEAAPGITRSDLDLDNDGNVTELAEQIPVRWGFNSPFKAKDGDPVNVTIFVIEVDEFGMIGETDRRWRLNYRDQAVAQVNGDGSVTVTMPGGAADLYEQVIEIRQNKGKFREWKTNEWRGGYYIPFEVTLKVGP